MELAYSAMGVAMGVSERRGTSSGTPFSCLGMAKGSGQEKRGGGSRGRKWMAGRGWRELGDAADGSERCWGGCGEILGEAGNYGAPEKSRCMHKLL